MRLLFWLDKWEGETRCNIEHAIFELGVRIGIQFGITYSNASTSGNLLVVRYGPTPLKNQSHGILDLPCIINLASISKPPKGKQVLLNGNLCWVGSNDNISDVIYGAVDLLQFAHESDLSEIDFDGFDRIKPESHPFVVNEIAHIPFLENNAKHIRNLIEKHWQINLETARYWGIHGRIVALSHDCDGPRLHSPFALARSLILGIKGNKKEREAFEQGSLTRLMNRPDPYWSFQDWLQLEQYQNARSTFFLYPGRLAERKYNHQNDPRYDLKSRQFASAIEDLKSSKCEIGIHSGIRVTTSDAISQAMRLLSETTGLQPKSNRAHYWSHNWKSPYDYWKSLCENGIENDASLSLGDIGFRNGSSLPICPSVKWQDNSLRPFVVLPTTLMDAYVMQARSPKAEAHTRYKKVLSELKNPNSLAVTDWHVRTLSNIGPWKGYLDCFLDTYTWLDGDSVLFTTISEAADMWRAHVSRTFIGQL